MNERECEACIKRKTMYCPNSSECFDTDDRPHWEDRITLLEKYSKLQNNWNELKKFVEEESKLKGSETAYLYYGNVLEKMKELENGNNE